MPASTPENPVEQQGSPFSEAMLPGEEPESATADDARHWMAVYRELLCGVGRVRRAGGEEADARLRPMAEHYARRLQYWRQRPR